MLVGCVSVVIAHRGDSAATERPTRQLSVKIATDTARHPRNTSVPRLLCHPLAPVPPRTKDPITSPSWLFWSCAARLSLLYLQYGVQFRVCAAFCACASSYCRDCASGLLSGCRQALPALSGFHLLRTRSSTTQEGTEPLHQEPDTHPADIALPWSLIRLHAALARHRCHSFRRYQQAKALPWSTRTRHRRFRCYRGNTSSLAKCPEDSRYSSPFSHS